MSQKLRWLEMPTDFFLYVEDPETYDNKSVEDEGYYGCIYFFSLWQWDNLNNLKVLVCQWLNYVSEAKNSWLPRTLR